MKQAVKQALAVAGMDVVFLTNPRRKVVGFQVKSLRDRDNRRFQGFAAEGEFEGRPVLFFVADEKDEIQGVHAKGRFYEAEELAIIRRHYRGGLFVDVGANVGNHTLFAALVLDAPRVIAFEPNPAAAVVLRCNIALNDLMDHVSYRGVGLAEAAGLASIAHSDPGNLGGTRLSAGAGTLRLERGDDALAGEPVAFVKIDVEGMELAVLAGLRETIARWRPKLFVEVDAANSAAFKALVPELGYAVSETFERYAGMVNYLLEPTR